MSEKKYENDDNFDISNIKYYYGIPNFNTIYSTGKISSIEAYEYAYKIGLNFMFLTDHNSYLSDEVYIKENIYSKFQGNKIYSSRIRKKYGNFIPLVGFKSTTDVYGDINIINSNNYFTNIIRDFKILTLWMCLNPDAFISISNPKKNINFIPHNEVFNKIITSIEVMGKDINNKIQKYEKPYFKLLDSGWMLGAISGENLPVLSLSDSEILTACICNSLSTASIISAFRERRTYSTESRYLKFYFTINDIFMGQEEFLSTDNLKFMIFAEDLKYKIKTIQIITNTGKIIRSIENINLNSIKYLYRHKREDKETWYIIKIIEDYDKVSYSSPIFIKENTSIN